VTEETNSIDPTLGLTTAFATAARFVRFSRFSLGFDLLFLYLYASLAAGIGKPLLIDDVTLYALIASAYDKTKLA
jgi:hypothetical protein